MIAALIWAFVAGEVTSSTVCWLTWRWVRDHAIPRSLPTTDVRPPQYPVIVP